MAREINLNHICKIEGHASLTLKIEKNSVTKCELKASEGARFFEALVLNRNIEDIQEIVSRICGICSCSHSVASVQALEEALNIKPSEQQKFIREILTHQRKRSEKYNSFLLSLFTNNPKLVWETVTVELVDEVNVSNDNDLFWLEECDDC